MNGARCSRAIVASVHGIAPRPYTSLTHFVRSHSIYSVRLVPGTCLAIPLGDYSLPRVDHVWHAVTTPAVTGPAEEMEAWKWNR